VNKSGNEEISRLTGRKMERSCATTLQLFLKNHEHSRGNRARAYAETSSLRDGLSISFKKETILFLHTFETGSFF